METYRDFLERIGKFETAELNLGREPFEVSRSLSDKVGPDNRFRPFFGDTAIFDLDNADKAYLDGVIGRLYSECGECFCERLERDSLHLTLHDLSSSPCFERVRDLMRERGEYFSANPLRGGETGFGKPIVMKAKSILNMVNISLVMGFYPADEENYLLLASLYEEIEKIAALPYAMTPHITLAYYGGGGFGEKSAAGLKETVKELNERLEEKEVVLRPENLFYEHFFSMNIYKKIHPLIK